MGVKLLLEYLDKKSANDEVLDFIKLAKTIQKDQILDGNKNKSESKLTLVVDGESCLNRLYGGFHSDWICGGQWNRMASFIRDLATKIKYAKIEMIVFFNGAIEPQRMNEWISNQKEEYRKLNGILKKVERTSAPPIFRGSWTAPVGLRSAIRMMLREMNINVVSTIDDHRQEVIAYCRENNVYGLIADDAEYIAFHPSKLFSAMSLKLRYRGPLEAKEFKISDFMSEFDLSNEKLCVLAALLGNYLLPEEELADVYKKADVVFPKKVFEKKGQRNDQKNDKDSEDDPAIPKLAKYVSQLNVTVDLDNVAQQIFGKEDSRSARLKHSIQYYLNGTKDGFLKYRSISTGKTENTEVEKDDSIQEPDLDTTALASEAAGHNKNILNEYDQASACLENGRDDSMKISNPETTAEIKEESDDSKNSEKSACSIPRNLAEKPPVLPHVSHEVMRTLSERHSKGLMSPYIYQILSQGEIKLPVIMQQLDGDNEIPDIYEFYKLIRQMVYAIVFNLHHHNYAAHKEKKPLEVDIRIKEWVFNREKKVHLPEYVSAAPVGWGVPTIQRLWFGTLPDDKRRRLRAFLTCMRSDVQYILNPDFVPQELLMAAVVLRYIMSFPEKKILRKQELDAFIVTALSLDSFRNEPDNLQNLKDPITPRNIQLAVLFMKGVEMALLVNDACGAPIPWLMCCPWLFFDGKLFNHTYQKAITCKNLQELCDNRLGVVLRAERMRQAILEGLNVQFARPSVALKSPFINVDVNRDYGKPGGYRNQQIPPSNLNRSAPGESPRGRRSLGGCMKVAGVTVSSWAPNYNVTQPSFESPHYIHSPPQYANKKNNNKPKDRKPGGRGRGRGRGMTVGSGCAVTENDLPNDIEVTLPNDDEKFDSSTVNGGETSQSAIKVESEESNPAKESSDSLAAVPPVGSE